MGGGGGYYIDLGGHLMVKEINIDTHFWEGACRLVCRRVYRRASQN